MNAETSSLLERCLDALADERRYLTFEHEQVLAAARDERMRRALADMHLGKLAAIDACMARVRRAFTEHAALVTE